ncbi:MAG: hypothetical protein HY821_20010 [Acidobacteria bacterium]|nr:hypothetical protein [Acidobacteriota bacterium]
MTGITDVAPRLAGQSSLMRAAALLLLPLAAFAQEPDYRGSFTVPYDHPVLNYAAPPKDDRVAKLRAELAAGKLRLAWDPKFGYLPAVLKALEISPSSQGLVFSKTSLQVTKISPQNPRAIYFNDDAYVGFVPGGDLLEISASDPERGAMLFSIEQKRTAKPEIERGDGCLQCHATPNTTGVPGHLVRSVHTDLQGFVDTEASTYITDHRSPFEQRWGGWYVTGTHGTSRHMGNAPAGEPAGNVVSLRKYFDTSRYLTPHSDIVALMVLEHQTKLHNLFTRAGVEARAALRVQAEMNTIMKRPAGELSDTTARQLDHAAEIVTRYLLFADEPPLSSPVSGTSDFARTFAAQGPKDRQGRSLREFDLETRLFKYPCSYLIYSESFARLPQPLKQRILARVDNVLSGRDTSPAYARLSAEDRRAAREILAATLTGQRSE